MSARETLQRSRRLLSVEPNITVVKPRTFFGIQCPKLPKTTGLADFENIPETSEIRILKKNRTQSYQSSPVLNLVMFKPGLEMGRDNFSNRRGTAGIYRNGFIWKGVYIETGLHRNGFTSKRVYIESG